MKIYEALKKTAKNSGKIAAIGIVAALPYICDSCAYSNHKASAAEIRVQPSQTYSLEDKLDK